MLWWFGYWSSDYWYLAIDPIIGRIPGQHWPSRLHFSIIWIFQIQSKLAIRHFLVALKLFLNAKSSLSLWSKWQIGHRKFVPYQNVPYCQVWLYVLTKYRYLSTLVINASQTPLHSTVIICVKWSSNDAGSKVGCTNAPFFWVRFIFYADIRRRKDVFDNSHFRRRDWPVFLPSEHQAHQFSSFIQLYRSC